MSYFLVGRYFLLINNIEFGNGCNIPNSFFSVELEAIFHVLSITIRFCGLTSFVYLKKISPFLLSILY